MQLLNIYILIYKNNSHMHQENGTNMWDHNTSISLLFLIVKYYNIDHSTTKSEVIFLETRKEFAIMNELTYQ